jgi:hypothetical protein
MNDIEEGAYLIYTIESDWYKRDSDRIVHFSCFIRKHYPKCRFAVIILQRNDHPEQDVGIRFDLLARYLSIYTLYYFKTVDDIGYKYILDTLATL